MTCRTILLSLALALTLPGANALAQAGSLRREVIRGRATTDGTVPVPLADVVVTMAPDRQLFQTKTDSAGYYRLVIANGTGDYLVHVGKIGYTAFRKRVQRTGADTVYVVDAKMPQIAQKLEAVQVQAAKPKPQRGPGFGTEVGASEQVAGGVNGQLSPDQAGDLTAIASTIPGIASVTGGISAFGLGPGANNTTLNGMAFAGADLPRDASTRVRVSTSTYDPSRGWFSGAQTAVDLNGGGLFSSKRGHITVDAPALQYTDPISARLGQRVENVNASYAADGSMTNDDKYFYSVAVQGGQRSTSPPSLLTADSLILDRQGVSPDSVARLQQALAAARIPMYGSVADPTGVNDALSFSARFDKAPYDWKTLKPSKTTESITAYGKFARTQALQLTTTATPGHAGQSWQGIGMVQGLYSTYIHDDYLAEARSGLSVSQTATTPYLRLPDGQVLVASSIPGGVDGLSNLQFGGNGSLDSYSRQYTWESIGSLQAYAPAKQPHRLKLDGDVRLDGYDQHATTNPFGSFAYNSLADLEAGNPASFSRTLNDPLRTGSEWNGFASLGDSWRVSPTFQLLYGLRAEANRYNETPAYNPAVEQDFGLRTDHAPDTWGLSPRIGFTWLHRPGGNGFMINPLGSFTLGPATYVRGGVGLFRNMLQPTLLSNAMVTTGLPGGIERITCLGAAAPTPDWNAFALNEASIPTSCVPGAPNPVFADTAPSVQLFDRSYTAPRSWRGNLGVSSSWWKAIYALDASYSLNLNQPGIVNANFTGTPRFLAAGENRPVFVPASAIVASTGGVSNVPARVASGFGQVIDNVSNLQSRSRQITATVTPNLDFNSGFWRGLYMSFAYTYGNMRAENRGFDGATFGDPRAIDWSRGDFDIRHSFLATLGITRWGFGVSMLARLSSGLPFTPLVGSDVNGDGLVNDRAFIFNQATTPDAQLLAALDTLRSTAPASVRRCLDQQLGRAAGRNSCEGPWTSAMNAVVTATGRALHLPRSVQSVSLNLTNPLGGLDQLLHGANDLHGWGTQPFANPILYNVRGFDPSSDRFNYVVNPRFGTTNPTENTLRAPFRLTLDIAMNLGRQVTEQQLERWLNPGRDGRSGEKLSADDLKKRYARTVPDPYDQILRESDSLLLTRDQLEAVQRIQTQYQKKMDTHWQKLAGAFAALPDRYDVDAAFKAQEDAEDGAWAIAWADVRENLPKVLSPLQLTLLPFPASLLWKATEAPKGMRIIIAR